MSADPVKIAGSMFSAYGALEEGKGIAGAKNFEAAQVRKNANAVEAESQRAAIDERRKNEIRLSRAMAVAAAGGADTTDVGITNLMAEIDREGEYNALNALFTGKKQAGALRTRADVAVFEGKQAKAASRIKAVTSMFSAMGSYN